MYMYFEKFFFISVYPSLPLQSLVLYMNSTVEISEKWNIPCIQNRITCFINFYSYKIHLWIFTHHIFIMFVYRRCHRSIYRILLFTFIYITFQWTHVRILADTNCLTFTCLSERFKGLIQTQKKVYSARYISQTHDVWRN